VRSQYASRHPESPEPTIKFNDWAFAAHAFVLCAITYTQFFPNLWGFTIGRRQKASRVVLGIVFGSIIAVMLSIALVYFHGPEGKGWELIDVVGLIYRVGCAKG
jgi:cystinosin